MNNVRDNFMSFFRECNRTFKIRCYQNYINNLMRHRNLYSFLDSNRTEDTPEDISVSLIDDIAKQYNIHHIEILPFSILQIIDSDDVCHMFKVGKNGDLYDELSIKQISELMRKLDYARYLIEMRVNKNDELDYHLNQIVKFISNRSNLTQEYFVKWAMSNDCWERLSNIRVIINKIKERYKNVTYTTNNDRVYDIIIRTRNLTRKIELSHNYESIMVDIKIERRKK